MIFFNHPLRFLLLLLLLPLSVLFFYDWLNRKKAMEWYPQAVASAFLPSCFRALAFFAFMLSLIFAVIAVAGPYTDKHTVKKQRVTGNEMVFLVDVSKSMLAEDVAPSRLERVKLDIIDYTLAHPHSKYALIAFAGTAVIKSPLTGDSFFFSSAVRELNAFSVSRGSTSIASALQKGLQLFPDSAENLQRLFVVFTDGEDHEDDPLPIATQIESKGGKILFIVLGNEREGARIPVPRPDGTRTYLLDSAGREVWSKPNVASLLPIAKQCPHTMVVPAYDRQYRLESLIEDFIQKAGSGRAVSSESELQVRVNYCLFPFVLTAFLAALASMIFFLLAKWRFSVEP